MHEWNFCLYLLFLSLVVLKCMNEIFENQFWVYKKGKLKKTSLSIAWYVYSWMKKLRENTLYTPSEWMCNKNLVSPADIFFELILNKILLIWRSWCK